MIHLITILYARHHQGLRKLHVFASRNMGSLGAEKWIGTQRSEFRKLQFDLKS